MRQSCSMLDALIPASSIISSKKRTQRDHHPSCPLFLFSPCLAFCFSCLKMNINGPLLLAVQYSAKFSLALVIIESCFLEQGQPSLLSGGSSTSTSSTLSFIQERRGEKGVIEWKKKVWRRNKQPKKKFGIMATQTQTQTHKRKHKHRQQKLARCPSPPSRLAQVCTQDQQTNKQTNSTSRDHSKKIIAARLKMKGFPIDCRGGCVNNWLVGVGAKKDHREVWKVEKREKEATLTGFAAFIRVVE
ncbi:MAG: hypothetical protein JOS17DRAFT_393470 [Linnemannia elongata]|nr:MAG: hypothetical protein JOS17DRAFT_393470 [Linnemannia elongata]